MQTIKVPEIRHAFLVELPEGMRYNGQVKETHERIWDKESTPNDPSAYYFADRKDAELFAAVVGLQAARGNGKAGNARHARKGTRKTARTAKAAK